MPAAARNRARSLARRAIAPDIDVGTWMPIRASRSAGASASGSEIVPKRASAPAMPASVPGTPTVRCPVKVLCSPGGTNVSAFIAAGACSRKSSVRTFPSGERYTMYPPPPMPQDCGRAELSAKTVVTAASIALPPRASTARPSRAAAGDSVATTPPLPLTPSWYREPWTAEAIPGAKPTETAAVRTTASERSMQHRYPRAGASQRVRSMAHRARQRLDEVLELLGRPALVGLAVLLVGRDHRVAVVPIQPRLGVQPEGAARLGGDLGEDVGAWVAAVGAGVAEHDDRRTRVQVVLDLLAELAPDAAVVGVARDVGHAGVAGDRLADGLEVALLRKDLRDLGDPLDEHERAHLAKRVVQRVQDRQEEDRGARDRRRHVAQDVDLGAPRADGLLLDDRRHAAE